MFSDYQALIDAGSYFLATGKITGYYPLPFLAVQILAAKIPFSLGLGFLLMLSLIVLVGVKKWQAVLWAFYIPVLQVLFSGQVDILFMGLVFQGSPIALALCTMKPQLLLFAIPKFLEYDLKKFLQFIGWCLLLYGPITLIRPAWISDWIETIFSGQYRSSATLWTMPVLLVIIIAILLLLLMKWADKTKIPILLSPAIQPYSLSLLLLDNVSILLIPLSWILQSVANSVQSAWPLVFLTLYVTLISDNLRGAIYALFENIGMDQSWPVTRFLTWLALAVTNQQRILGEDDRQATSDREHHRSDDCGWTKSYY